MCDKTLEDFLGKETYNYYMERIKVKKKKRYRRELQREQMKSRLKHQKKQQSTSSRRDKKYLVRKGTEQLMGLEQELQWRKMKSMSIGDFKTHAFNVEKVVAGLDKKSKSKMS